MQRAILLFSHFIHLHRSSQFFVCMSVVCGNVFRATKLMNKIDEKILSPWRARHNFPANVSAAALDTCVTSAVKTTSCFQESDRSDVSAQWLSDGITQKKGSVKIVWLLSSGPSRIGYARAQLRDRGTPSHSNGSTERSSVPRKPSSHDNESSK